VKKTTINLSKDLLDLKKEIADKNKQFNRLNKNLEDRLIKQIKAEEALILSEAKYRSIFENAMEGIFQTTIQGKFLMVNLKLAQVLGYESVEDIINLVSDLGNEVYVAKEKRAEFLKKLKEEKLVINFECQFYKKNKQKIWVNLKAKLVLNPETNITYIEGFAEDITKRKIAEAKNQKLNEEIANTQKEIIFTLGEIVESRSKETAFHVKRVSEYCCLLAKKSGLREAQAKLLANAAPMHDIGKIGIADIILQKSEDLTIEEYEEMKRHTNIGYNIFKNSKRPLLKTAAIVAYEHHEKWDGTGYPLGLAGAQIHIFGRIVAIADVFDALCHKRVYKGTWPLKKIIDFFQEQKGKHFDPQLIEIFLANIKEFTAINKQYLSSRPNPNIFTTKREPGEFQFKVHHF